jgi:N6-adenosine-specific RNA methylase IME4
VFETAVATPNPSGAVLSIDAEFKSLIPPLSQEEYTGLEASIVAEGCRDAIVTWDGTIIDGHNRYEICQRHGIVFRTEARDFPDRDAVIVWIIDNQLSRRNISAYARVSLELKKAPLIAKAARENQRLSPGRGKKGSLNLDKVLDTAKEIADLSGVSRAQVARVQKIEQKAPEEVKERLVSGDLSINEAYNAVRKQEKEAQQQLALEAIETLSEPTGKYHVLVVDPPWPYEKRKDDITHAGKVEYPTMTIDELAALELPAEDDAILWLWTTNAFMHEAFHLCEAWGFQQKTIITWVKQRAGIGQWALGQTEHCLLCVKGKPVHNSAHITHMTTALFADRREHSRKPDEFYDLVEKMCYGRKLDYFSREKREGWDQWGAEADAF